MALRRVAVRVPEGSAEEARAALLELVPEGFEEAGEGEALVLVAYVDEERERQVLERFPDGEATDVPPGYEDAWRDFHRPVTIGPLWVGPPWSSPDPGLVPVVVDPGRAFGTGAHATTRLCLELLLELPRSSVLDVGCGSGVLAIAAAKLGFSPVVAIDVDEAAVEATAANARVNGVRVDVRRADALADPLPEAELALANIELRAVETVAARVDATRLLLSGILASERPRIGDRWALVERRELDGWAAELLARR